MQELINISPDTAIIASYKNGSLVTWRAIAELLDNSFDAGANRISIDWDVKSRCLTITDDGVGCKEPGVMAKLGGSFRQAKTGIALGRYGIGLKEASVWLCDRMTITSAHEGGGWRIVVDWKNIQETGVWEVAVDRSGEFKNRGVCIELDAIRAGTKPVSPETKVSLSETFRPAILSGRQIIVDGKPIAAPDLPLLKDQVDEDLCFEGKSYNVKYGIKSSTCNAYGWTIAYGHRVLVPNYTKAGFGEYSPTRFFGYITLYDTGENKWSLNRFKDGFDGIDALLESLAPSIEQILKDSEAEGMDLEIQSAVGQVTEELNRVFGQKIKEKRPGCAGEEGTVEPKKTGRRRIEAQNADPLQPGSVAMKGGRFTKFKVLMDWHNRGMEIGHCDEQGSTLLIHLNPNHPRFLGTDSRQDAMRECAVSLLCGFAACSGNEQLQMRFTKGAEPQGRFQVFKTTLSNVLASVFGTQEEKATA